MVDLTFRSLQAGWSYSLYSVLVKSWLFKGQADLPYTDCDSHWFTIKYCTAARKTLCFSFDQKKSGLGKQTHGNSKRCHLFLFMNLINPAVRWHLFDWLGVSEVCTKTITKHQQAFSPWMLTFFSLCTVSTDKVSCSLVLH